MQKHRSESVEARHGSQQIVAAQFSAFSSPLPPAEELARYEQVQPGFSQAILLMAQKDQDHQHQIETRAQETERKIAELQMKHFGRGQYIGGGIAVLAIIGAVVASILGSTGAAVAIISTVMVPIGAAFALGKWHEKKS